MYRLALHAIALTVTLSLSATSINAGASKPPIRARNGMVVSSNLIASQVGVEVLRKGGNAVDAAVATGLALAVVHPSAGNIGGGGFMIAAMADGKITSFDFREKAPLRAHEKMYVDPSGRADEYNHHEGFLSIGVPGTVAGFDLALKQLGTKSWKELAEPAIRLAQDGIPVSWALGDDFAYAKKMFLKYPSTARVFMKKDTLPYEAGDLWRQPDLAKTLKRIQKSGKDGFYKGETAKKLAEFMKANGGLITETDLAAYEAKERVPVRGTYRGYDIVSMCPPSSGGTVLVEMLNILEGFNLKAYGHNSAHYLHLLAETMRRAYADRARYLGDPDFNPEMPMEKLLSKSYAATLRRSISLNHASPSDAAAFNDPYESQQTTHFSVVDAWGNAVVVTYTLEDGYGSKIVADGLGFLLNDEMGDFNAVPGLTDSTGEIGTPANLVQPGKRMLSSMTPTIVLKDGKPFLLIGSPGGRTIMNTVLQVVLNTIDFQMNVSEAITAGRIHHQWLPDKLRIERYATSPDTENLLVMMGHKLDHNWSQGEAMGIMIDPRTGLRLGASDPRDADAGVAGY
jgi:gamma-glutamyltranspeptidase / glutathione hydrolase